jgi:MtN3 and saliva related transmembrane protein
MKFVIATRMNIEVITGIAAGCLTTSSTLPQIVKTIRSKDSKDVSVGMFSILVIGVGLWVAYGIMKNDLPIIIFNSLAVVLNILMIFLKFKYR